MESKLRKPKPNDYIWVDPGVYPEYPYSIFKVTSYVDMGSYQIAIKPPSLTKPSSIFESEKDFIWVNYDPTIHRIVEEDKIKEFLEALYGRIKSKT